MNKVALITGASSGMGKSAAYKLKEQGYTVYGAARRTDRMKDLEDAGMKIVSLDLTVEDSITECVDKIMANEGRIDVLINNAGYGSYGSVEEVPLEEARRQFEVNIFGLARITQLIIPIMRQQKSGRIVNISSMGGRAYLPMGAWYHATKFALEGWSDCLRLETEQFGIDVVLVEPGGIKTEWGGIAMESLAKTSGSGPYSKMAHSLIDADKKLHDKLTDPDVLGAVIAEAATVSKPKTRYVKGYMAKTILRMRRFLSDRAYDKAVMRQLK